MATDNHALRLILLTSYFPPDSGSAATLFHELGAAFVRKGHKVTVVTSMPSYHPRGDLQRYKGRLRLTETIDGMKVIRISMPAWAKKTMVGRAFWQFASAATFTIPGIRQPAATACLVYSPPLPLGITAWVLRRIKGTPFVLNAQDLFPQNAIDLGVLKNPVLVKALRLMERFVYRNAGHITVHSPGNAEYVVSHGGDESRTSVVHNWVESDVIKPGERINEFRAAYGIGDSLTVSFGGVLGYSQDLDTVIDAARLMRDRKDIVWLIVGDGAEKPRLERKASDLGLDNVRFAPMLPRDEYITMLQASDVGLATLRKQVQTPVVPSKIMSIMAAGIPVLAAMPRDGDAVALVEHAGAGLCVAPENPDALAEAVSRLASDGSLRHQLGASGRRYVEQHLSIDGAVLQYETIIRKLAGQRE